MILQRLPGQKPKETHILYHLKANLKLENANLAHHQPIHTTESLPSRPNKSTAELPAPSHMSRRPMKSRKKSSKHQPTGKNQEILEQSPVFNSSKTVFTVSKRCLVFFVFFFGSSCSRRTLLGEQMDPHHLRPRLGPKSTQKATYPALTPQAKHHKNPT